MTEKLKCQWHNHGTRTVPLWCNKKRIKNTKIKIIMIAVFIKTECPEFIPIKKNIERNIGTLDDTHLWSINTLDFSGEYNFTELVCYNF